MAKSRRPAKPAVHPKSLHLVLEKQLTDGEWAWSVALAGEPHHLDEVDHVVYILPSTFPNPVRTKSDRASGFRMEEEGPGQFTLYAKVVRKDKQEVPLRREVNLSAAAGPADTEPPTEARAGGAAGRGRPTRPPPARRLRVYSLDPSLATQMETAVINQVTLKVPWEPAATAAPAAAPGTAGLSKGPVGEYLEVIDWDPASGCYYAPVDLNDPHLLAQDGLPPSEGTPQFHQQMVYAVAMTTIANFERALGRRALWAPHFTEDELGHWTGQFVRRLRIYPHALRQANAYYSPQKKALLFGYFPAAPADPAGHLPGGMVFTCLSHDVIVHETTHALLDGLHRRFIEASNPDSLAFHEAFADIVALFQHFSFPDVLKHQLGKTRGDLNRQNLLGELAQEFGQATGRRGALRDALGKKNEQGVWEPLEPVAGEYRASREPHDRGSFLVAAMFDAFLSIYKTRVADLLRIATGGTGVLPEGQLHPDLVNRLAAEAAKSARHVLAMCIRALDYCPPVDLTFGEYLRALITADYDLVPDDDRGYRVAVIEAFRRRGIYPDDVRALSEESLRWHEPTADEQERLRAVFPTTELFRQLAPDWDLSSDRESVFNELQRFQAQLHEHLKPRLSRATDAYELLGLDPRVDAGKFEVHSLRPARRIGPDGQQVVELIVEITQRLPVFFRDGRAEAEWNWLPGPGKDAGFWFRGGCTLLLNPETADVRYVIAKRITNQARFRRQSDYVARAGGSLRATYFGVSKRLEETEAFALLHQGQPEEETDE
jgi:hypothetical protein